MHKYFKKMKKSLLVLRPLPRGCGIIDQGCGFRTFELLECLMASAVLSTHHAAQPLFREWEAYLVRPSLSMRIAHTSSECWLMRFASGL